MTEGRWVGDPLSVSLFFFLPCPFCSSSPMGASIARDGSGGFTSVLRSLSFSCSSRSSFLLLSFLGVDALRLHGSGI